MIQLKLPNNSSVIAPEGFNDWSRQSALRYLEANEEGLETVLVTCTLSDDDIKALDNGEDVKLIHVHISVPIYPAFLQFEPAG